MLVAVAGAVYLTLGRPAFVISAGTASRVDFSRDQAANYAAAQGPLSAHLEAFPNYAGDEIVSSGILVNLVGPPSAAIRAVVARDDPQYQGKPVPVRYRSVRHTLRELQALVGRIGADEPHWRSQGLELSSWGWDVGTNLVRITLVHYTKAYRNALLARYGSDWVAVYPHDFSVAGI